MAIQHAGPNDSTYSQNAMKATEIKLIGRGERLKHFMPLL